MTVTEIRWHSYNDAVADGYELDPTVVGWTQPAPPQVVEMMLCPNLPNDGDGRSEWMWVRLPDGTLIFGCFPQGDTYFAYEQMREV